MIAFCSLKEGVGGGFSKDLEDAAVSFTYTIRLFGLVTSGVVIIQGSLNDDDWYDLDSVEVGEPNRYKIQTFTAPHAVRFVRAFATDMEGTLPRVTVHIAPHWWGA